MQSSGVTEDQVLSMAIEIHLDKLQTMSYDGKDFPNNKWSNHLSFKILRRHPKFMDNFSSNRLNLNAITSNDENRLSEIDPKSFNDITHQTEMPNSRNISTVTLDNSTGTINETTSVVITGSPISTQRAKKR